MIDTLVFSVGLGIFATYLFFLVRIINKGHKDQEKELEKDPEIKSWKAEAMKQLLEELNAE